MGGFGLQRRIQKVWKTAKNNRISNIYYSFFVGITIQRSCERDWVLKYFKRERRLVSPSSLLFNPSSIMMDPLKPTELRKKTFNIKGTMEMVVEWLHKVFRTKI